MKKINPDLLEKAGRPLSPGEGFQGATDRDGVFTKYERIDQYMTQWQVRRHITGTMDQQREARRVRTMRKAA